MLTQSHPLYRFHATAMAVSGTITRPIQRDFTGLVKSELPNGAGGYLTDRRENHRVEEILSFTAAYTSVTGSEGPSGTFNTLAIATVENLNILDIVKAERITARLAGMHKAEDFGTLKHPWIIPLGSEVVNLRIAGRPYDVKHPAVFHLDLNAPPTYDGWKKEPTHKAITPDEVVIPRFGKIRLCQLSHPKDPQTGHTLHELTMLEFILGSPVDGEGQVGRIIEDGGTPPG